MLSSRHWVECCVRRLCEIRRLSQPVIRGEQRPMILTHHGLLLRRADCDSHARVEGDAIFLGQHLGMLLIFRHFLVICPSRSRGVTGSNLSLLDTAVLDFGRLVGPLREDVPPLEMITSYRQHMKGTIGPNLIPRRKSVSIRPGSQISSCGNTR